MTKQDILLEEKIKEYQEMYKEAIGDHLKEVDPKEALRVTNNFIALITRLSFQQKQSLAALREKIENLKLKKPLEETINIERRMKAHNDAISQVLSLLQDKLDNENVIQPNPSKVGQDKEGSDIDAPTKEDEERGIDME